MEQLRLKHKQKLLETINQEDELLRQQQALEAATIKRRLEEQEAQRLEQHAIETRLHVEKTNHETHLKEIELAAEIQHKLETINQEDEIQRQKQAL